MQKNLKTSPKFTRLPGFKGNIHDQSWLSKVAAAIKAGTSAAVKAYRNPISYHGSPPKWEDNTPIAPRPVTEIAESADVPGVSDLTRKIDPNANVPIHQAFVRAQKRIF